METQGLIQAFEYTFELAWKVMKDFSEDEGYSELYGSKSTLKVAFRAALIEDRTGWAKMVEDRNRSVHTYNKETARQLVDHIYTSYSQLFVAFRLRMEEV